MKPYHRAMLDAMAAGVRLALSPSGGVELTGPASDELAAAVASNEAAIATLLSRSATGQYWPPATAPAGLVTAAAAKYD